MSPGVKNGVGTASGKVRLDVKTGFARRGSPFDRWVVLGGRPRPPPPLDILGVDGFGAAGDEGGIICSAGGCDGPADDGSNSMVGVVMGEAGAHEVLTR